MIKKSHLAIVITSIGNHIYLDQCLRSIFRQTEKPAQIILVLPKNKNYNNSYHKLEILYSRVRNQVHQRNLGISKLSNDIKILVQLDDRVILEKNAIKNIIKCWNLNEYQNVAGIGFNDIVSKKKSSFNGSLLSKLFRNYQGSVLKNGMCIGYQNFKYTKSVSWLKGGLASYDLRKIKNIKKRSFPIISWSVCEDLLFSYEVQKNNNLLICSNAKARLIMKKKIKSNFKNEYNLGKLYSHNLKYFVKINKNLSLSLFYLSILVLFIYKTICDLLSFNYKKIMNNIGMLSGLFSKSLFKK